MDKQASTMALRFPNPTRYYDATRRAVRFWGHDSAMEATFFVTEDALKRVIPVCGSTRPGCSAHSMRTAT
jgi:Protein of unknown function (DUF1488)